MRLGLSFRRDGLIVPILLVALASSACVRSPEAKSAAAMEAGKKLLEQKDSARAILQFRNAVQATPTNPETHYQLSLAYLAASDYRQAVQALRRALELNPKHAGAQLRLAQLMASVDDQGVLKDAQDRLSALLQDSPDNAEALHALGLTELKLGDPDDAMQHLQHAISNAPKEVRIAITLSQAKLQQKDIKGAEAVLVKVAENSPESVDAQTVLADFYISQKRPAEAETHLQRALQIEPKSGSALLALGRLQFSLGRKPEAEQNFKRLETFPGYESTYGIFLSQEGRHDEALKEFERLAKEHPDDRQIRTWLVTAYSGANRPDDARKKLSDALKKNAKDADALLQRAELYLGTREYSLAEADLNRVVKLQPDGPEVHYLLARLNRARGNMLVYRQQLSQTLMLNPYLLAVRLEAFQDLLSSKNYRAAIDLLDQAPEAQRQSTALLVQRNWALWALGDMPGMRKGIDLELSRQKSPDLLVQDGMWKLRAGQTANARAAFEAALNLNPNDFRALDALNQTYTSKEEPLALQKVKEYAARAPQSAPIQHYLGVLLMRQKDVSGARKAFMAAKSADPHFVKADLSLVQLDVLGGKSEDGRNRLRALNAAGETDPTIRLWLGNLEDKKGNSSAAIDQFRKVVEAEPDNAQALNNLAYLLAENSAQREEALKYAQKAVELAPEDPAYGDTLGWILYQKGLYGNAVKYLERAGANRSNVVWKYHLAMAYAKAGQVAQSKTTLQAALKLNPNVPEAKIAQELVLKTR